MRFAACYAPAMRIVLGLILALCQPLPAAADCACRAKDVVAQEGQTMCLATPWGPRLARCDKVLNNSSWTFFEAPCPVALTGPDRSPISVARGIVASRR